MLIEDETSRRDDTVELEDRDLIPMDGLHDRPEQRAPESAIRTAEEQLMMNNSLAQFDRKDARIWSMQAGKIGWALLWLLGIPLPVLIVLYLIRGH